MLTKFITVGRIHIDNNDFDNNHHHNYYFYDNKYNDFNYDYYYNEKPRHYSTDRTKWETDREAIQNGNELWKASVSKDLSNLIEIFYSERVEESETKARRVKFAAALETTNLRHELSKIKGKMIDMIAEIISWFSC